VQAKILKQVARHKRNISYFFKNLPMKHSLKKIKAMYIVQCPRTSLALRHFYDVSQINIFCQLTKKINNSPRVDKQRMRYALVIVSGRRGILGHVRLKDGGRKGGGCNSRVPKYRSVKQLTFSSLLSHFFPSIQ
jgi:hypothetical protein